MMEVCIDGKIVKWRVKNPEMTDLLATKFYNEWVVSSGRKKSTTDSMRLPIAELCNEQCRCVSLDWWKALPKFTERELWSQPWWNLCSSMNTSAVMWSRQCIWQAPERRSYKSDLRTSSDFHLDAWIIWGVASLLISDALHKRRCDLITFERLNVSRHVLMLNCVSALPPIGKFSSVP